MQYQILHGARNEISDIALQDQLMSKSVIYFVIDFLSIFLKLPRRDLRTPRSPLNEGYRCWTRTTKSMGMSSVVVDRQVDVTNTNDTNRIMQCGVKSQSAASQCLFCQTQGPHETNHHQSARDEALLGT